MTLSAVDMLAWLLDEAFDGNDEHSLIGNIKGLAPEDWAWTPEGGGRTIAQIVEHAGIAKYLYYDHLFGGATASYASVRAGGPLSRDRAAVDAAIAWTRDGHARFVEGVRSLRDDDLLVPRRTHWGETGETRWIINIVLQHDVYHAGEINHLRALRHGDDRWPWQSPR